MAHKYDPPNLEGRSTKRHAYALFKTADGEIVYVDYCEEK